VSKPYDAAGKDLLAADPAGWAAFLGVVRPPDRVDVVDSDLSTVTAAADKVIRVKDDPAWLINIEFQSWRDPAVPWQLLKYNALLHERHGGTVASVLVVLAEKADSPAYSGRLRVAPPLGPAWEFAYTVVRVWELSAEKLLAGPLALLPLAPVADVPLSEVPGVIVQAGTRLEHEADPATTDRLLTAIGILLQLRYGTMTARGLMSNPEIREIEVFRLLGEDFKAEGAKRTIARQGRKKFGEPTTEQEAALNAITDPARLEALAEKVLDATTWDEFLKAD
jgi:hypothetical protein